MQRRTIALMTGILLGGAGTALAAGSVLGSALFRDVPVGSPYDGAIGNMVHANILEGFNDGTFHPDEYVTRGQLALALDRLLLSVGKNALQKSAKTAKRGTVKRKAANASSAMTATNPAPEEGAGSFRFTTTGFQIIEKAKSIAVSIQRVNGNTGAASISYATEDITTTHGTDYVDTNGTLTFGNGETAKTITIPLKDDTISEGREQLRIQLRNPTGASLGAPSAMVITLLDDESPNGNIQPSSSSSIGASSTPSSSGGANISFSALLYSIGEGSATAPITITRNGVTSGQSTVEYETLNGTALAGSEYTATKGTLTFASGEVQKTFTIPITNNNAIDGMKTVNLSLKNPIGASLASPSSSQLAIVDDEVESFGMGSLKFQKSTERVNETTGEVSLTILRIGGSKGSVSINYATKNGLAIAGSDYTDTSGTIIFLEGEAEKIIRIPITKDANALEEDENFSVSLSNGTGGASVIDPTMVTITIVP
ncbi:S-layer homology domain-containing protein [Candidatus Peregrinibacteria bacterium]|nr:S-layer homology domain-containing protein [Candidatus Peregrinibacteria bacterium]